MEIRSARYVVNAGYPELHLDIDGLEAVLATDNKRSIRELGYVFLGDEFAGLVPNVVIPPDPADDRAEMVLRGYTDNPAVLRVFDRFIADCSSGAFAPGSVSL